MPLTALSRAAFHVPSIRRLHDSMVQEASERAAATTRGSTLRMVLDAMLTSARPGSFFATRLNGTTLDLPVETLRTMVHCIHPQSDRTLDLWVETAHLDWMRARMAAGGTFLDVGASTGATALPCAAQFGGALRVIAYEPASEARRLLAATITRNGLTGVEVRPAAVSDTPGEAIFRELPADETGATPWQPESSSLVGGQMPEAGSGDVMVPVVTLDEEMQRAGGFPGPVVVKIDVEGFEAFVLRGATALIQRYRPPFAIDIHADPFGEGSTEAAARSLLEAAGYTCTMQGHVLLCERTA